MKSTTISPTTIPHATTKSVNQKQINPMTSKRFTVKNMIGGSFDVVGKAVFLFKRAVMSGYYEVLIAVYEATRAVSNKINEQNNRLARYRGVAPPMSYAQWLAAKKTKQ